MVTVQIDSVQVPRRKRRLNEARVRELASSIAEIGLLNPITVSESMVLRAGRHRLEACRLLGHSTITATVLTGSDLHAELAEIDENLVRNDLTVLEQGEHLKRRDEILAEFGLRAEVGDNQHRGSENISPPPKTTADIASEVGLSERVAQLRKQAADLPEPVRDALRDTPVADNQSELLKLARMAEGDQQAVAEKIVAGDAKTVKDAARDVKRERRQEEAANAQVSTSLPDMLTVVHGDFRDAMRSLDDASVAMVFADPPYDAGSIPLYEEMAREAERVLVDGGSLMCYAGHYAIGDIIAGMSRHLRFWWTCGVKHTGQSARLQGKCVFVEWKPILWFVKRCRRDGEYVADMVTSTDVPSKEEHEWQQGLHEAMYYIERLTSPGELVVDPFLGSGTTLVAAAKSGRRGWGCEVDASRYEVARGRLIEELS